MELTCACSNVKSRLLVLASQHSRQTPTLGFAGTNLDLVLLQRRKIKLVVNREGQGMMAVM